MSTSWTGSPRNSAAPTWPESKAVTRSQRRPFVRFCTDSDIGSVCTDAIYLELQMSSCPSIALLFLFMDASGIVMRAAPTRVHPSHVQSFGGRSFERTNFVTAATAQIWLDSGGKCSQFGSARRTTLTA